MKTNPFRLPELGYQLTDLAPMMSYKTMSYHYGKHFQTYIDNLNRIINNSHFEQPDKAIEKEELTQMISEALGKLTEKENRVVVLYYYEEMTLKEISEVLEVSESRVSQLHTKALVKLKKHLGGYMEVFTE
jgi:RNA polymerase sigma factor (sigma-70 family)